MSGHTSVAIHALLLIRLQAWYGSWLSVASLAQHLAVQPQVVRVHLQAMADAGEVALRHDAQGLVEAACIGPGPGERGAEPATAPPPEPGHAKSGPQSAERHFRHLPPHPACA